MKNFRQFIPISIVSFIALLLIIFKWHYLSLPCYWDEGFPYAQAIRYLADHHLSLSPDAIPPNLSKGHPTLFFFLAACWMKIFGTRIFVAHLFPLAISVLLLFVVYRFGKTFFNPTTGILAVLLFSTRTLFIAQSTLLLPETLVALFSILALHSWLQNKKIMYVIWASLLVLTKESGLVLVAILCCWELISIFRYRNHSVMVQLKNKFFTVLPFFVALAFFIVQKIQVGYFFYPEHIGDIDFGLQNSWHKLFNSICAQFFIYYGGIAITLMVMVCMVIFIFRKMKLTSLQRRSIFAMLFFILGFFIFSAVNFYSPRYILCLYPFWFTIAAFICVEALKGIPKFIPVFILIGIAGFQIWFALNIKTINDCDLGYADCVITQRDAIRWCVKNNFQQKEIFAQHQLERAMESDAAGFVQANEEFKHVGKNFDANTALFIFTCNEHDPSEDEARKLNLKTIIKFEEGKAWTEICALQNNK